MFQWLARAIKSLARTERREYPSSCETCNYPLRIDPRWFDGSGDRVDIYEEEAAFCSEDCRKRSDKEGDIYEESKPP